MEKTPTSDKGLLIVEFGYYAKKLTNLTAFIYVCDHKFTNNVLNVEAVLAAFNRDKALVGAFSVITNLRMDLRRQISSRLLAISDLL